MRRLVVIAGEEHLGEAVLQSAVREGGLIAPGGEVDALAPLGTFKRLGVSLLGRLYHN